MKVSDQIHAPAALPSRKKRLYRWIEGCVHHKAGLDVSEERKIQLELKKSFWTGDGKLMPKLIHSEILRPLN